MLVSDWLAKTTFAFKGVGIESARLDALLLLEHYSDTDRSILLSVDEISVDESELEKAVRRRTKREPLAYILGYKDFYGYKFKVDQNVLIPRPESEIIVEFITTTATKGSSCLDIGTGSGALAISIKKERPDLQISASDISKDSLMIAESNARELDADIKFIHSDILSKVDSKYDYIVANLPYVTRGGRAQPELGFEPDIAIYADEDGLAHYKELASQLPRVMDKGVLVIEHEPKQLESLRRILKRSQDEVNSISKFVSAMSF